MNRFLTMVLAPEIFQIRVIPSKNTYQEDNGPSRSTNVDALNVPEVFLRASTGSETVPREFPQVAPQGLQWQLCSQDS